VKSLSDYLNVALCNHKFTIQWIHQRYRQTDGRTDGWTDDILMAIPRYARTCFAR